MNLLRGNLIISHHTLNDCLISVTMNQLFDMRISLYNNCMHLSCAFGYVLRYSSCAGAWIFDTNPSAPTNMITILLEWSHPVDPDHVVTALTHSFESIPSVVCTYEILPNHTFVSFYEL